MAQMAPKVMVRNAAILSQDTAGRRSVCVVMTTNGRYHPGPQTMEQAARSVLQSAVVRPPAALHQTERRAGKMAEDLAGQ